ncbi:sialic acid-binding Ig-like lectin 15 isoform X3 [Balearica regulorum gibbericeps]|uniref:sialic acid-binding Ig-like lectin 15 isoform X3 n=1 Tax=Balearica regulorum gibbericeps TaxID=100784 RepID=UPI003F6344DC
MDGNGGVERQDTWYPHAIGPNFSGAGSKEPEKPAWINKCQMLIPSPRVHSQIKGVLETQVAPGTDSDLTPAPRIINITVSNNGDRTFQARCTAEGEPAPTLTWTGPPYSNLTSITSMNHRVTKELRYLTHDGKYTCTAVNSHGRAEGAVYFYKFKASSSSFFLILIFVPLGIKVLILLVILSFIVFSRGGHSCKIPPTRTLTADTAAARLCRQREQHQDAAEDLGGLICTHLHSLNSSLLCTRVPLPSKHQTDLD